MNENLKTNKPGKRGLLFNNSPKIHPTLLFQSIKDNR